MLVAPKVRFGPQLPADLERERDPDQDHNGGDGHDNDDASEEPIDRSIYNDFVDDERGWYEDGAYIARPVYGEQDDYHEAGEALEDDDEIDPEVALHASYYATLMDQYVHLRSKLHSKSPVNAASRLPPSLETSVAPFGSKSHTIGTWTRILNTTDPHPLQITLMSKDSVLRLLRVLLGGKFLRRGHPLPERTSRWLWALLARLPERGELNHLEIGWVRDLGRRAVLLGRSLAEMAALREELQDGGLGVNEGVDASSSDEDVVAADNSPEEVEGADTASEPSEAPSPPASTAPVETQTQEPNVEEGEVEEDEEDVAMDLASDSEGEVTEDDGPSLEDVKSRLLAQLDNVSAAQDAEEAAKERSRMNLRATLNMILTVAGEFYGQRDLLEFREPFLSM